MRVLFDDASAVEDLTSDLDRVLFGLGDRRLTVVCVGTDRSTGDAFGPIVGTKLKRSSRWPWVEIFGTLDEPVHAVNLASTLEEIHRTHTASPYIIAVDACLGKFDHVGQIIMEPGPLRPGAGVKKSLPAFGDYTLTGVVNVSGFMEYFVLQNTRLGIVMRMSDVVVEALLSSFHRLAMRRTFIGAPTDRSTAASREAQGFPGGTLPAG
ncbi:spore protease YyaC [Alicyclobacillus sp. ALC3]|nr:spore protease YyaC [Alicyclobacillus sp. ALC3]